MIIIWESPQGVWGQKTKEKEGVWGIAVNLRFVLKYRIGKNFTSF
jgi:hypothetical protein